MNQEQGYEPDQAKNRFRERPTDSELRRGCDENDASPSTNNAKDFEPLHRDTNHAGLVLFYAQAPPDADPEGLARTVDEVLTQYGTDGARNEMVALDEWYDWLH